MDGCMLLNKSSTVISESCKDWEKKTSWVLVSGVRVTVETEEFTNYRQVLARLNWVFLAVDNSPPCIPVTIFPHGIGHLWLVNPRQLHLARAVRAASTEHAMPFQSVMWHAGAVGLTAGILVDWFRQLNILKLISTGMARQQLQFGRDLQVCFCQIYDFVQKRVFYTRTGRTACVCVERATPGHCDATCVCLHVCLSACFCGFNPRTVPQLSLNKFRAPLGYRGLVLGLNVSVSFVLWVLPMEHVQSKFDQRKSTT